MSLSPPIRSPVAKSPLGTPKSRGSQAIEKIYSNPVE